MNFRQEPTILRGARDRLGFIQLLPDVQAISNAKLLAEAPALVARGLQSGLLAVRKSSPAEKVVIRQITEKREHERQRIEDRRATQKLMQARRRAEERGEDLSQFPPRIRTRKARRIYQRRGWIRIFILDRAAKVEQFGFKDICELCPIIPEATARRMCIYMAKKGELECVHPGSTGSIREAAIYRLSRGTKADAGPLPSSGAEEAPREGTRPTTTLTTRGTSTFPKHD